MAVHLHDYGQAGIGAGGAPINYSEVSRLLLAERDLAPTRLDFHALVAGGSATALRRVIRPSDFARAFYQQLFPHLTPGATAVLYPLAAYLPVVQRSERRTGGGPVASWMRGNRQH